CSRQFDWPTIKTRRQLREAILVIFKFDVVALRSTRSRSSVFIPCCPNHRRAVAEGARRVAEAYVPASRYRGRGRGSVPASLALFLICVPACSPTEHLA